MKTKQLVFLFLSGTLLLFTGCAKEIKTNSNNYLETLQVSHSVKGWELYSWQEGDNWYYSILTGTNRTKTYDEVTSYKPTDVHLISVTGIDSLKLALAKFPENENITWPGKGWLQRCWGGNYGNLQLPPQNIIDELTQYCNQRKLNLQVTD